MNLEKIFSSEENPLVSIVRTTDPHRVQRAMGFVYKNLSRKIKVVVTCKHNFYKHPFEDFQFYLNNKNIPLEVISPLFSHEHEAHDFVFCVVRDHRRHRTVEFNIHPKNPVPFDGQILYNSKCDYHPDKAGVPFYVMRQPIFITEICYGIKALASEGEAVKPGDEKRKKELVEDGCVVYPTVGMKSVPGCSGSPVFDNELNLYGVNARGVGNLDVLVYVPISEINETYRHLEFEIRKYGV